MFIPQLKKMTTKTALHHRKKQDGTQLLTLRVAHQNKNHYISLGVSIYKNELGRDGFVKRTRINADTINAKIRQLRNSLESAFVEDRASTIEDIINRATNSENRNKSLYDHFQKRIEFIKVKYGYGSWKRQKSILQKLRDFRETVYLKDFTVTFLKDFEAHCIEKLHNTTNTIASNMSAIRALANDLTKERILKHEENPFLYYKITTAKTKRERLSSEELKKLMELNLETGSNLWHARNLFLFSFYCAGIRIGDLCRLRWSNITDNRLTFTQGKTDTEKNIKLVPPALAILENYKGKQERVFNLLQNNYLSEFAEAQAIESATARINAKLKQLAKLINTNVNLSSHISRHVFADFAKSNGTDVHTLKDLFGHGSVKTTEIYMKSFYSPEADEALSKMFC